LKNPENDDGLNARDIEQIRLAEKADYVTKADQDDQAKVSKDFEDHIAQFLQKHNVTFKVSIHLFINIVIFIDIHTHIQLKRNKRI